MKLANVFKSVVAVSTLALSSMTFAANIEMNADSNDIAIKGYDTVAYFTQHKPVSGSADYTATYNNAIYQFSSAENRDLFRANPAKYAPQYGGYCAFGVTVEQKFDTDPTAWHIADNKLYLNLNPDVQKKWLTDVSGYINTAEENWPEIKGKTAAELDI
ncbi:MAG: YHS domain-containing (seleno)protein [Amphritea sp.]